MTSAQTSLYWRLWAKATASAGWKGKTPAIDETRLTDMGRRVVEVAQALQGDGSLNAELLRHACHALALGRLRSSKKLTNAELDRVLLVFRLVADGDDIAAVIAWDNPAEGETKRLTWSIRNTAPEPLILRLCRDKFGRADWENLAPTELRQLLMTLTRIRQRQAARAAVAP